MAFVVGNKGGASTVLRRTFYLTTILSLSWLRPKLPLGKLDEISTMLKCAGDIFFLPLLLVKTVKFLPQLLVLVQILDNSSRFLPLLLDNFVFLPRQKQKKDDPEDNFEQRHVDIIPLYALSNLG